MSGWHPRPETFLGAPVTVTVDRPLGSLHPVHGFPYEVNYGFVAGTRAPDGEPLDAYVLGVDVPVAAFTGRCVALLRRAEEADDKLVVVPEGDAPPDEAILAATRFQERWFTVTLLRGAL